MLIGVMAILLQAQTVSVASQPQASQAPKLQPSNASSRCVSVAESPDQRVSSSPALAPGPPPMLSFRYFEGKLHHRFNNSDLMLDDAGH